MQNLFSTLALIQIEKIIAASNKLNILRGERDIFAAFSEISYGNFLQKYIGSILIPQFEYWQEKY